MVTRLLALQALPDAPLREFELGADDFVCD
jgi:hypothetical protein